MVREKKQTDGSFSHQALIIAYAFCDQYLALYRGVGQRAIYSECLKSSWQRDYQEQGVGRLRHHLIALHW